MPLSSKRVGSDRFDAPFYMVLLFLFFDYGRPQSFFPFIEALHPGWFIQSVLFLNLIVRHALRFNRVQTKYFASLLLLMSIHVPLAVNNYWAFQTVRNLFLYFIVYLSIATFVDSYVKLKRFIDSWITINCVCAIVGLLHGGKIPNSSFMGDENDFALVMAMAIPFAYFMFLEADRFRTKLIYLFAVGLSVAANVASLSRGGFIALAAVGLFCLLKSPRKTLGIVVLSLMVAVFCFSAPPTYIDEVRSIKDENIEEGTGKERWYSWQCGWRMFLDHPIIGVGQGNFSWNVENYEPSGGLAGRTHGGRAAHSIYFTLIPELGVVGTVIFLGMLHYSLRGMKMILNTEKERGIDIARTEIDKRIEDELRKLKHIILGVQGSLFGYFVAGIFLSVLYYPHFWILMALSLAVANVGKSQTS